LLHVSSSHKFSAKVKVLPVGLFQIENDVVVRLLQVALIRVEYDGLFFVVFSHEFHSLTGNGWLEIGLLGIDHHSHV
jgi:hypothetical protein